MDEVGSPPDPSRAATAAEYVAALARLRRWSGLTYRQLATKAGGALPASTTAGVLGRATLPRESFVVTFVAACGLDDAEIDRWVRVRRSLAVGAADEPAPAAQEPLPRTPAELGRAPAAPEPEPRAGTAAGADPDPTEPEPAPSPGAAAEAQPATEGPAREGTSRRPARSPVRRWWPALVAAVGIAVVLMAAPAALRGMGHLLGDQASASRTASPEALRDGWYRISPSHVTDRDLCVGEGRERSGRTDRPLAVQRSCAGVTPGTYLKALGAGVYEIQWHHPEEGAGCLTVDQAYLGDEALLAPANCTAAAHQRFLLEPERKAGGYVLRPVHSGKCLGLLYGEADIAPGAELAQHTCSGKRDQTFRFQPADAPDWVEAG